jgi:hypothetical protein
MVRVHTEYILCIRSLCIIRMYVCMIRPNGSTRFQDDFDDAKSPLVQRQRRRQDYISGHYLLARLSIYDIHEGKEHARFQVAWLHHNIDGPYSYESKPPDISSKSFPSPMILPSHSSDSMRLCNLALEHVVITRSYYYCPRSRRLESVSMWVTRQSSTRT